MRNVMLKAQELGEAILQSDIYTRMKEAEALIGKDEQATLAVAAYMEKRDAVQAMLADREHLDPARLAALGAELQAVEAAMNEQPAVQEMQAARKAFDELMVSVNRVLELVVNGSADEAPAAKGCTGSCATCTGCGAKA